MAEMAKSFKQARIEIVARGLKRTETEEVQPHTVDSTEFHEAANAHSQHLLRGLHGCSSTDVEEVQFYEHFKNLQKEDGLSKITKSLKKKPRIDKQISNVPNLNLQDIPDI
jgi:hypothetical protein